jgi:hypothetical protein
MPIAELVEIPTSELEDVGKERFFRIMSYPVMWLIPLLVSVVLIQCTLPQIRIGVDQLWDPWMRVLVLGVAILPVSINSIFQARHRYKLWKLPRLAMGSVFISALLGSALALAVAYLMKIALTWQLGLLLFVLIIIWIWVTGVVSAYIAGQSRIEMNYRRAERTDQPGQIVPVHWHHPARVSRSRDRR